MNSPFTCSLFRVTEFSLSLYDYNYWLHNTDVRPLMNMLWVNGPRGRNFLESRRWRTHNANLWVHKLNCSIPTCTTPSYLHSVHTFYWKIVHSSSLPLQHDRNALSDWDFVTMFVLSQSEFLSPRSTSAAIPFLFCRSSPETLSASSSIFGCLQLFNSSFLLR